MSNRQIKILAIDHNDDNLISLKSSVMDVFCEAVVLTALGGATGLQRAAKEDPDVMLLNISMPGMEGFEICAKVKSDKKLRDIPVIFITAVNEDRKKRIQALECGADGFISKPMDAIDLTVLLRTMIKLKAANIKKRDEKKVVALLVKEKTKALEALNANTLQLVETLKEEKVLIEAIFDSIPGYLYVYDESGKLIKWNKKHETMTGYTAEELEHMTLDQWFDKEDILRVNAAVREVFKNGYGEVEAQLILKNGDKMMIRSSGVPLISDGNNYFIGIGIDITEQKRAQDALLESQAILKAAFENSQTGIAIADAPDGSLRYVNKAGLLIRGQSEDLLVKDVDIERYVASWNIMHLDGTPYETDEDPLARAIRYGETCSKELIIRRDDLIDRYVIANAAPIKDAENNIQAGIVVFLDITERKNIEVQLHQHMDDLLESQRIAHVGTWRLNLSTNEVEWSDELYNMYGLDPSMPPPPYTEHMKLFTPDSWHKLSTSLDQTRLFGIPYELELETVTQNGLNGWMWVRGEALRDSDGNITELRGAAQDITERKINENKLIYLSNHDHLTQLYNRRFFEEELKRLDIKENLPLSIIMCDVNGLKLVNDSFGHDSGDKLLVKAAETIKKALRETDLIARIGGDEFVVLMPKTPEDECEKVAKHIKELSSQEMVANVELSISYGYDTKTTAKQSVVEIIANAENHMYRHKLYERSSLRSKTIDFIMNALFEKSSREAAHSNRVGLICESVASQMNLDKDAVKQIKIAGLIHDIGKIGVDENILNKPGSLNVNERSEIEKHPEIGWRLLSSTNEFSELAQFVLNHHEKWDGSGYPNGFKGETIPIEARIIGVVDAYDAMTSERSYRKALCKEEAIKELIRCSGTQFDPRIVDVLVHYALSDKPDFME